MARPAAVVGTGQTRYVSRREDVNVPELVREAALRALEDAGLQPKDVDAVIVGSAPEIFEGVNNPENWIGPAVGAAGKPVMRIHTGGTVGASATIAGFYHVASGLFDVVLVVAYEKLSDGVAQYGLSACYDPLWDRDFACGAPGLAGLQATQYLARHAPDVTEEHGAMVAVKNRRNAIKNPYAQLQLEITVEDVMASAPVATPLKLLDCCPTSDGAAAIVIAADRRARRLAPKPAWFAGVGTCSESPYVPHVDMAYPESCVRAAQQAYQMAWIYEPYKELDMAEIYEAFSFQELIWTEALGLCAPGEGGRLVESGKTAMDGEFPVNPSGGVLSANPIGASAMIRQIEAAMQVMGRAGEHQIAGVKKALAHSWGGAIQFSTVTVFSDEL
ncbi:MAG: thiolase C-terminal domain-containing protein [Candidatus Geothermincolia bacterium]